MMLRPRWLATITYATYLTAGVSFMFWATTPLYQSLGPVGLIVWNLTLIVGASVCLLGCLLRSYRVEMIGLPSLIVSLLVYSVSVGHVVLAGTTTYSGRSGIVFGISAVFSAAAIGATGRLYELWHLTRITSRVGKEIRDE